MQAHIQKLPVFAGDPVTVIKICCDCVDFCRIQSNMVSYTHTPTTSICGHNPGCSSKHGICRGDPLSVGYQGILAFHTYLFQLMYLKFCNAPTQCSPLQSESKSTTCIHVHLPSLRTECYVHPHRFVVACQNTFMKTMNIKVCIRITQAGQCIYRIVT